VRFVGGFGAESARTVNTMSKREPKIVKCPVQRKLKRNNDWSIAAIAALALP